MNRYLRHLFVIIILLVPAGLIVSAAEPSPAVFTLLGTVFVSILSISDGALCREAQEASKP